jgi:hypothetical protein
MANVIVTDNTTPADSIPPSSAGSTPSLTISYASVANPCTTLSVVSSLPGYPATFSVPPHAGLESNSARGNNLIHQILSSNLTSNIPPASTITGDSAPNDDFIQIDGTFYHRVNAYTVQHEHLSSHGTSPARSSLMDGGANAGGIMTSFDIRVIST